MREVGLLPSRYTYDGFVKAVITGKGVTYGMKVVCLSLLTRYCRCLQDQISKLKYPKLGHTLSFLKYKLWNLNWQLLPAHNTIFSIFNYMFS